MVRPSESSAVRWSSVTTSAVTRMCCVSTAEKVIPGIRQLLVMFGNNLLDPPQLLSGEASATFEPDGNKPEFGFALIALHVNMSRFIAVASVKEKPIRSTPQDCRHRILKTV